MAQNVYHSLLITCLDSFNTLIYYHEILNMIADELSKPWNDDTQKRLTILMDNYLEKAEPLIEQIQQVNDEHFKTHNK